MKKKPLYILTYDHGGYVLWKDEVKPRLKKIFEWMEKYPKLRIGLDYESFTFDEFSKCDPEVVKLIGDLLKKYPDRVGLGATTYGQPLSLTISEESNARQLLYAVRTNLDYYGVTPPVYCISEFALNNQTPQLASLCGYKAAIMRSHVMGYGYTKTFDSPWGLWVGKDGTEIPSVPTYDKQGRGFNCCTVDNWILSRWPESELYSLEDFEEMYKDYSPLLASRYDDLTQPIEQLTAYIENKDNYEYVLLEDIPELYGEAKDKYLMTDNDFHVQMPWGYCGNEIFNGVRKSEVEAVQAEKLNAVSVMLGGSSCQKDIEYAWKYALAAQHHDVTICGLLDLSRRFIPESLEKTNQVKAETLKVISRRFASENEETVIVFNPHSFEVDEWVECEVNGNYSVYDGESLLESENVLNDGVNLLRMHVSIPPLTIKRLSLKESDVKPIAKFSWDNEKGELSTPCYRIKLTDSGIAFIDDVKSGRRILDNGNGELFSAFVEDVDCKSVGKWTVDVTPLGASAVQTGMISTIPYRFEMHFSGDSPRIDCKTRFEMHNEHVGRTDVTQGRPVPLTLNGHHHEDKLCFIMNLCMDKSRRMVRDLPYSISDWNGALRKTEEYWYPDDRILIDIEVSHEESFNSTTYTHGIYWFGLRDDNNGLAVFNKGCMGAAIQGNRVLVPLLYSNEYMCGTRILNGVFEDEFAIYPFDAKLTDAGIHRRAIQYSYPPINCLLKKGSGDLTQLSAANIISKSGEVILTAMYSEDNDILVRFCNYSDEEGRVEYIPSIGKLRCVVDLLGNKIADITGNELAFRPWEIKTIKITL